MKIKNGIIIVMSMIAVLLFNNLSSVYLSSAENTSYQYVPQHTTCNVPSYKDTGETLGSATSCHVKVSGYCDVVCWGLFRWSPLRALPGRTRLLIRLTLSTFQTGGAVIYINGQGYGGEHNQRFSVDAVLFLGYVYVKQLDSEWGATLTLDGTAYFARWSYAFP